MVTRNIILNWRHIRSKIYGISQTLLLTILSGVISWVYCQGLPAEVLLNVLLTNLLRTSGFH